MGYSNRQRVWQEQLDESAVNGVSEAPLFAVTGLLKAAFITRLPERERPPWSALFPRQSNYN